MNEIFTPKQAELVRLFKQGKLKRINLLEGAVRSGKTWISLVLWALWVAATAKEGGYLMAGRTLTSLKRNALEPLRELVGGHFSYTLAGKEGRLFGRRIYLEGAGDARAEGKIRGLTLQGAYLDEATLLGEDFFSMLLSRLSEPGAKLIATTNPDTPLHWLRQRYILRAQELDLLDLRFLIDDNTFLPAEYVDNLKKEYTGVFYDRYIRGEWVAAEGLIYDMYRDGDQRYVLRDEGPFDFRFAACDYGTQNPCTFGVYGVRGAGRARRLHLIREYFYDGRGSRRQKTDGEYAADLKHLAGTDALRCVVVDPSAASFMAQLRSEGWSVRPARNNVLEGVRLMAQALQEGRFTADPSCQDTRRERQGYVWDSRATQRGEDAPLKVDDHTCDRDRYACQYALGAPSVSFV